MARLIDADALIRSTDKESVHAWEIALAPTVDAVEVVRCKDCEWWNDYEESCFGKLARADDYCSWGERREDDTN